MRTLNCCWMALLGLLAICALGGCSSTPGSIDPWEKTNRALYDFNDGLDHYVLKPMADGFVFIVPKPIRKGLDNAFDNLGYFNVIFNDFLQGKVEQGISDSCRMLVNSSIGLGGIFDVATVWELPSHDNDFGITLGKWGLPQGPYMVLPLFGPTTVRDSPGIAVGIMANPLTWVNTGLVVTIPLNVVQAVDLRARAETELKFRDQAALDPYIFTRDAYLQYRQGQVQEGKAGTGPGMYDDDSEPASRPSTEPATQPGASTAPAAAPAAAPASAPAR